MKPIRLAAVPALALFACGAPANGTRVGAGAPTHATAPAPTLERVCVERDAFVLCDSRVRFRVHGFNYDHDRSFRLVEDYWDTEPATLAEDFREMRDLGANVARIHLQTARFMTRAEEANEHALRRLDALLDVAAANGVRVLLTGLGEYRPADAPAWYEALDEHARWDVQSRFWRAVGAHAARSPATFGYDLMNEPVVPHEPTTQWVHEAALDGLHFIQYVTRDRGSRAKDTVARAWAKQQADAIRAVDPHALVTIGMISSYAGYEPADVDSSLDFQSVHLYPKSGHEEEATEVLRRARTRKPVIVEEFGPIECSVPELERFVTANDPLTAGWVGFYWGKTPAELRASGTIADGLLADSLDLFARIPR